jgi:hypothetical protein
MQCPKCGLLADVPGAGDLAALDADGSYKISDSPAPTDPAALREMQRVFARDKHDAFGNEVDLRGAAGAAGAAAGSPAPSDPFEPPPERPRYDPETGELIVPLAVTPTPGPPPKLPVAMAVVADTGKPPARGRISIIAEPSPQGVAILLLLLKPLNLLVIIIYAIAIALTLALLVLVAGLFLTAAAMFSGTPGAGMRVLLPLLALGVTVLVGSHLPNVIDEIGCAERDELPRPLRDVSLYDDLWAPAWRMLLALLLTYGPWFAWRLLMESGATLLPAAALAGDWLLYTLAGFAFPAVLLTLCTSGSYLNLRPDRAFAPLWQAPLAYSCCTILWLAITFLPMGTRELVGRLPELLGWPLLLIALPLLGSYLVHAFGWLLGLLYRNHHDRFDWVWQQHLRGTEPPPHRAFQVLPPPRRPAQTPPPRAGGKDIR